MEQNIFDIDAESIKIIGQMREGSYLCEYFFVSKIVSTENCSRIVLLIERLAAEIGPQEKKLYQVKPVTSMVLHLVYVCV